ncbi:hypothetical protein C1H46_009377 [Malus baccata]|uniref:RRM Nup35-type domain-containing protein n=1 Tax=Malus baccata TaxID=106549 RepID=A0A540N1T6_MALBA|nr:hypothetical protein C1H46_009377 [Malus baccata]
MHCWLARALTTDPLFISLINFDSYSDAQKALSKNGMQINRALIIGVKPLDPIQHHALNERVNNQGFMTFPPQPSMKHVEMNASRAPPRPYYLQNGNTSGQKSGGVIASPSKSLVSKVMDLMFGM